MSGIYIKNMEMPKSCRQCNLMIDCDGCEGYPCYCSVLGKDIGYKEDVHTDKRRDDCPLIHVPEHGDLIDRDDLKNKKITIDYDEWDDTFEDGLLFVTDLIDNAPTIIPAEEGE